MGLKDFFKPKWKHSNLKVRQTEVDNISNQNLLADIAITDKDYSVCKIAIGKISDQDLLADVAINSDDWPVQKIAIEKITDQSILTEIAKKEYCDSEVRIAALEKLVDQVTITDIVKNKNENIEVRKAAVGKLTDQVLLTKIAMKEQDIDMRTAAIENPNFSDQIILSEIAKNDKEWGVHLAAVNKLNDQTRLADVARNSEYYEVRVTAVGKLTDQPMLASIAGNYSEDIDIRSEALKKLPKDHIYDELDSRILAARNFIDGYCPFCHERLPNMADIKKYISDLAASGSRLIKMSSGPFRTTRLCPYCNELIDPKHL